MDTKRLTAEEVGDLAFDYAESKLKELCPINFDDKLKDAYQYLIDNGGHTTDYNIFMSLVLTWFKNHIDILLSDCYITLYELDQ